MKRLYINRHAKSSWDHAGMRDFDRPLNKRGMRDAPFMAERFTKEGHQAQLIVSSPANRAITTARFFAESLNIPESQIVQDERIYHAHTPQLMEVVQELPDGVDHVIIFGHNPGFSYLVDHLTGLSTELVTCAIAGVDLHVDSWQAVDAGTGTLVHFDYPKKHLTA